MIKDITNSKSKTQEINDFEVEGVREFDKTIITNGFKDYFSCIGQDISIGVKPTINNKKLFEFFTPQKRGFYFFQPVFNEEIIEILDNFVGKTSTDVNRFSISFIKNFSWVIATPLMMIVNMSFQQGNFPDLMKMLKIIPIFKKGGVAHEMSSLLMFSAKFWKNLQKED